MIRYNGITIDRERCTISHLRHTHQFRVCRKRIGFEACCFFILGGGVTVSRAFEHFFGANREGGPLIGAQLFRIYMCQWRRNFLDRMELEIRAWRHSGSTYYEIVPSYAEHDFKRRMSYRRIALHVLETSA